MRAESKANKKIKKNKNEEHINLILVVDHLSKFFPSITT